MSDTTETFQISVQQAEMYESTFVPAIFADWAPAMIEAVSPRPGERVLDVACGTGVVARAAADRVGASGHVVGVDLNDAMLTVARRLRPDLGWQQGDAAELPFPDASFDVVLCQSALMFFPDPNRALREMGRVCAVDGRVGVQVYASLDAQPAYGPWVAMVARHGGPHVLDVLGTYWVHGDPAALGERFVQAGLDVVAIHTRTGTARWGSIDEMVRTEIAGTPLARRLGDEAYQQILFDSRNLLKDYQTPAGAHVPIAGHVVVARPG